MLEETTKQLPVECPSCSGKLAVKRLSCQDCGTEVEGLYGLPALAQLSRTDQEFVVQFVKASGSLKEMARLMKVSYPTIRNRLDGIIEKMNQTRQEAEHSDG
jgi:hypothetical protein